MKREVLKSRLRRRRHAAPRQHRLGRVPLTRARAAARRPPAPPPWRWR
jgi:hypothetical protein